MNRWIIYISILFFTILVLKVATLETPKAAAVTTSSTTTTTTTITPKQKVAASVQDLIHATVRIHDFVSSSGTAFVVSEKYAISAAHVCLDVGLSFLAIGSKGQELFVKVKAITGLDVDLCLLEGDFKDFPAVSVGKLDLITTTLGKKVFTVGYPGGILRMGVAHVFEAGMYLVGDVWQAADIFSYGCMPGASGSPVVDQNFKLIGVVIFRDYDRAACGMVPRFSVYSFYKGLVK